MGGYCTVLSQPPLGERTIYIKLHPLDWEEFGIVFPSGESYCVWSMPSWIIGSAKERMRSYVCSQHASVITGQIGRLSAGCNNERWTNAVGWSGGIPHETKCILPQIVTVCIPVTYIKFNMYEVYFNESAFSRYHGWDTRLVGGATSKTTTKQNHLKQQVPLQTGVNRQKKHDPHSIPRACEATYIPLGIVAWCRERTTTDWCDSQAANSRNYIMFSYGSGKPAIIGSPANSILY